MKARTVSLLFGVILVIVGLLGFAPNSIVGNEGFFATNAAHNLVHILTGGIFLIDADRWLHLGLAIAILVAGFAFSDRKPRLTVNAVGIK